MFLREFYSLQEKPGCNMTEEGRVCPEHGLMECPGYKMIETSAQEKLHQRHQEIRKKSGLPNPNYYKELKATFDLPDEERHVAVAALKKKYKIKEQAPTGHGQISTKYGADGTKVSFDPATGGKTVSGATGTTSYNVAGQKTAYQTPSINGTSQTTNYQTGEKTTTGQVGGISTSMTQRPDQSTVKTASTNLGDVTATTAQGIGFGGTGKNVQQGGNQVSSITNAQGQTTSFIGQPTQQDVEKAIPQEPVDEAGPFSYGAKKPKKGSVADLAAKKRQEQEKGRRPVEPKDHMVGVARVKKDVAEGTKGALAGGIAGGMVGGIPGAVIGGLGGYALGGTNPEHLPDVDDNRYAVFIDGRLAARNGKSLEDNPYEEPEEMDVWQDGWESIFKEGVAEGLRDPKDNPCWKGYKPVGTKKKAGKTVPNCVPTNEDIEKYVEELERAGYEVLEEKTRLDPKCWKGYRKAGTKMKGGVRVNNCVPYKD